MRIREYGIEKRRRHSPGVIAALLFLCGLYLPGFPDETDSGQKDLAPLLDKAAQYCERIQNIALHFVCVEEIKELIYEPYRMRTGAWTTSSAICREIKNRYVYDYQLVRKDTQDESRTLIEENKRKVNLPQAPLKTQRFQYSHVIFGPVGLLSRDVQHAYEYLFVKNKKLWGVETWVVRAVPRDPKNSDKLFGNIWLDPRDGSILRIEWEEASLANYRNLEKDAKALGAVPQLEFRSEYRFEKNGIRFPSRFFIREIYRRHSSGSFGRSSFQLLIKSELDVAFKDYKFFVVETDIKY